MGVGIDGGGRIADVSKGGERPLLSKVPVAVCRGIGENDKVLFVVRVRSFYEPDLDSVISVGRHIQDYFGDGEVSDG